MNKTIIHEQKNGLLTDADQIALSEMLSDLPTRLSEDDKAAFRDMAGMTGATMPGSEGETPKNGD